MCPITTHGKQDLTNFPVLNPGRRFGKAWLIEIGGACWPLFIAIDVGRAQDAIAEPGDTDLTLVVETDLGDYPNTLTGDATMPADVLIADCGSIALFTPMTPDAHRWVDENVQIEPWQRMGASIACEPRYLDHLVEGMQEDGLVVEPE